LSSRFLGDIDATLAQPTPANIQVSNYIAFDQFST
jgi:hypothetical protein